MRSSAGLRGPRRTPNCGPIREQHPGHVIKPGPMRSLITPVSSVSPASVRMVVTSVPVFRAKTRYFIIIIISDKTRIRLSIIKQIETYET